MHYGKVTTKKDSCVVVIKHYRIENNTLVLLLILLFYFFGGFLFFDGCTIFAIVIFEIVSIWNLSVLLSWSRHVLLEMRDNLVTLLKLKNYKMLHKSIYKNAYQEVVLYIIIYIFYLGKKFTYGLLYTFSCKKRNIKSSTILFVWPNQSKRHF